MLFSVDGQRPLQYPSHPTHAFLFSKLSLLDLLSPVDKTSALSTMAKIFAALLAAAALLQIGTAAPYYPPTNATANIIVARSNTTFTSPIQKREIRTFPIALRRP
ncbi:hypothetical protein HD806DRAFT_194208 [Xylariaceae sp. AK1471]|nr:hypothetical protein HD806DRAFT_194208 [Xylariaceae sp. AK1471]